MSLKALLPLLSALMLISSQKPTLRISNRPIVLLRLKSGVPMSCKVDLRGQQLFRFLEKLIFSILPRLKDFSIHFRKNILFLYMPNLFVFKEIEKDYEYFPELPPLTIVFVFPTFMRREEIVDFLAAFHFPFKKFT
jgi:large subunit ribosomal protein L5